MHQNPADMSGQPPLGVEPRWVTTTLRFLPVPVFAFAVAAFFFAAACFCFIFAGVERSAIGWAVGGTLASAALLVGTASFMRSRLLAREESSIPRYRNAEKKPTVAIFVLLISIYSWMLTLGLRIFRNFFAAKDALGVKYYLTLGIAIASSLYLSLHGRTLVRRQFGAKRGRGIVVTPAQSVSIFLFVLACGCYLAWLMN